MFEAEQQVIEQQIKAYCASTGLPDLPVQWSFIPFSGHWGIAASFFQLAAQEARLHNLHGNVGVRAQANELKADVFLGNPYGFDRVEAVKVDLKLALSTAEYA